MSGLTRICGNGLVNYRLGVCNGQKRTTNRPKGGGGWTWTSVGGWRSRWEELSICDDDADVDVDVDADSGCAEDMDCAGSSSLLDFHFDFHVISIKSNIWWYHHINHYITSYYCITFCCVQHQLNQTLNNILKWWIYYLFMNKIWKKKWEYDDIIILIITLHLITALRFAVSNIN